MTTFEKNIRLRCKRANQQAILKTVEDMGEVTVAGRVERRFEHSWSLFEAAPETEYRYFDGREIHSLVLPSIETTYLDYAEVPAPLRVNETTTGVDCTEQIDLNNDGIADQVRIEGDHGFHQASRPNSWLGRSVRRKSPIIPA